MNIVFENKAQLILLLLTALILISGSSAAIELKELTAEEIKQISLYENPSTGQHWQLENEKSEIITAVKEEYQPLPTKEGLVGRGGIHSWSLKGENKGFSLLNFKLLNDEEEKVVSQKRYLFAVDLLTEEISVDQILEIELGENPSTGYSWQLDFRKNKSLELLKQNYKSLAASSDNKDQDQSEKDGTQIIVGQGGIKSWTFRGVEAGYQLLTFKLKRSGGKAIKTVEYLVLVD